MLMPMCEYRPRAENSIVQTEKESEMKRWCLGVLMVALSVAYLPQDAYAKRLGGGRPAGMQRQMPAPTQSGAGVPAKPAGQQQAAPAATPSPAAPAAQAAGKRSWMGPLAGLAAGIGLAALFSHFGMGEAVSNVMMMLLLGGLAVFAVGWLMRRFGKGAANSAPRSDYAFAGASPGADNSYTRAQPPVDVVSPLQRQAAPQTANAAPGFVSAADSFATAAPMATSSTHSVPAGFDQAGFERVAKLIFIRMQAANDSGDLNDLRSFTTPEMFAAIRLDLQDRQGKAQQTDVEQLHAEMAHYDQEAERLVVSVRFHGLIREDANQLKAEPFDEIWHLVQPTGQQQWLIAGIQPTQAS